ncbi:MAG: penicillin-binding protein 2 [bacterium]|nr:penicillin-binding protein 2 [bacterium]
MRERSIYNDAQSLSSRRLKVLFLCLGIIFLCLFLRLGYWQILKASQLQAAANAQYSREITTTGQRGRIFSSDEYLLVGNQTVYQLVAEPFRLTQTPEAVATQLLPLILADPFVSHQINGASPLAVPATQLFTDLVAKMSQSDAKWTPLLPIISAETQSQIKALNVSGIQFESKNIRTYPEASMAAQLTGFLGKDNQGEPIGYFGVEGGLNRELQAQSNLQVVQADALGWYFSHDTKTPLVQDGRDVVLTIRRDIQHLAETYLQQGIEKYGAKSGEVIILEPSTGKILAMAGWPSFDPYYYTEADPESYKNASLTSVYEPGSTFKTLTVAAGIDAGVITPETTCPKCGGPRVIDKYTIRTWNDQYNPDITMREALAKSDNTAMIYITERLGNENFIKYLQDFGLGKKLNIELQGDTDTPFPEKWGQVELATRSFGQGINMTSLQLVRATSAIANQGVMMKPQIIEKVIDPVTQSEIEIKPQVEAAVLKPSTALAVSEMMVYAAQKGEAQWISSPDHVIAGKTGTSQIASQGSYDPDKTVASFIGFSPPENPKFIMLVKLVEPESSIWAAETAAPLWYQIAQRLFLLLNIPPDKATSN